VKELQLTLQESIEMKESKKDDSEVLKNEDQEREVQERE
jgi:hypothetical protein